MRNYIYIPDILKETKKEIISIRGCYLVASAIYDAEFNSFFPPISSPLEIISQSPYNLSSISITIPI